jgi:hypothetical protein
MTAAGQDSGLYKPSKVQIYNTVDHYLKDLIVTVDNQKKSVALKLNRTGFRRLSSNIVVIGTFQQRQVGKGAQAHFMLDFGESSLERGDVLLIQEHMVVGEHGLPEVAHVSPLQRGSHGEITHRDASTL